MLEQFWQYGIFLAVLIFGVKIGLAMGFAGIDRKTGGLILAGYGVGLIILSAICQPYRDMIYQFVYGYTAAIFGVIAIIILFTGLKTIYDWQKTGSDKGKATCMAMVAPCPCCFGAILASIIMVSPAIGVSAISLGLISAVSLILVMGTVYLLSSQLVKKINKPYPMVLGNFMIFMGLYFVLCMMILPNMTLITQGTAIELQNLDGFLSVLFIGAILVLFGVYYAKKKSLFIQY